MEPKNNNINNSRFIKAIFTFMKLQRWAFSHVWNGLLIKQTRHSIVRNALRAKNKNLATSFHSTLRPFQALCQDV